MDDGERDPPIVPQEYIAGVTVVNLGDVRVARGMSRRHHSSCPHRQLVYSTSERRIWCQDCERDVEGFDAFENIVRGYNSALTELQQRERELEQAEKFQVRLIATKAIEKAWRSRNMVPACPHCSNGLFPEDFKHGPAMLGKDYARARLGRNKAAP